MLFNNENLRNLARTLNYFKNVILRAFSWLHSNKVNRNFWKIERAVLSRRAPSRIPFNIPSSACPFAFS